MLAIQQYVRSDDPHGRALEAASDSVDEINIAILKAKQEADAYAQSQFDAEKNKDGFRQFVDENEGSRKFYMSVIFSSIPFNIPFRLIRPILLYSEQHTKQTVEYNLKARAEAFAKPRATLSVWEAMELLGAHRDLVFSVKHKLSPNRFCLYRHSCRRIRSRHFCNSDRPSPTDCRGHATRRQARVDAGDGPCARPRQAALFLWIRWTVGRCRRSLPCSV